MAVPAQIFFKMGGKAMLTFVLGCIAVLSSSMLMARTPHKSILPSWTPGTLDIHAISSGRGECYFIIFPDGTTLLVDAGEMFTASKKYASVEPRPSADVRPVELYAAYIRSVLPSCCRDSIDYALLTHFHSDHMGQRDSSGIIALYSRIPYRRIINRVSCYDEGRNQVSLEAIRLKDSAASLESYLKWLKGKPAEAFELGSDSQISLRYAPLDYPEFGVRNVCVNGKVWTSDGILDMYPEGGMRENGASCGFLLHYGPFEYLSCGDAGNTGRVEIPLDKAIGHPITAMKAHHHFSWNTMTPEMLSILRPRIVISESFYSHQPDEPTLRNVLDAGADVYLTGVCDSSLENFPETFARVRDFRGHFLIRVSRRGHRCRVYKLDDSCQTPKVISRYEYPRL